MFFQKLRLAACEGIESNAKSETCTVQFTPADAVVACKARGSESS
jgi:hypothetical protein